MKIWSCKIGEVDETALPRGSDKPMRIAIAKAYKEVTGKDCNFIFSGWTAELTEGEKNTLQQSREDGAKAAY